MNCCRGRPGAAGGGGLYRTEDLGDLDTLALVRATIGTGGGQGAAACGGERSRTLDFHHYAKFLDGVREQANRLIEQSMQEWDRVSKGAAPER
ncbi:hypothetical protein C9F11_36445 [Streptomyces sp. YIM 121038]|uniref:hypothetical protein n=1 Tax=Streptomyces sp. YIM 121038 TaxID=2136401 RepID=UPI00116255C1|nr:hypothetical protein [Streptomyces sp. YIM 121038]QCX80872.1 hypothetical protein C9F11_36445 [Streptomyces sp. YIM 121038]